jgi:hypothetical protein
MHKKVSTSGLQVSISDPLSRFPLKCTCHVLIFFNHKLSFNRISSRVYCISMPTPSHSFNPLTLGGDPLLKSNNPELLELHKSRYISRNLFLLLRILGLELSRLLFILKFEEYDEIVAKGELGAGERERSLSCGV